MSFATNYQSLAVSLCIRAMLKSVLLVVLLCSGRYAHSNQNLTGTCANDDEWAERSYLRLKNLSQRPSPTVNVTVDKLTTHVIIFLNNRESNILLDIYITVSWRDERFSVPKDVWLCRSRWRLDAATTERVWKPKLNFHGALEAQVHNLPFRNEFIWVDERGAMVHQQKLRLKIPCKLNFDRFPMDEAKCYINFAPMEYDDDKVSLRWNSRESTISTFFKNKNTEEHRFETSSKKEARSTTFSSHYTQLLATLIFQRQYSWYVLQAYVPSGLIIFVSWIHCTLRPQNVLPRLQIGSAMLLAVVVLFFNILQNVPRVGYVKALDVWLMGCITALISSAAETAIVALCMRLSQDNADLMAHNGVKKGNAQQPYVLLMEKRVTDWAKIARIIDNIFICFFPLSFIGFVVLYWVYYLHIYDYKWG